jgi:hypothetical protein
VGRRRGQATRAPGRDRQPPLAELMAAYAGMRGVSASALQLEKGSFDTWSNARQAAQLSPRLPRRIVLVTSWIHMARAKEASPAPASRCVRWERICAGCRRGCPGRWCREPAAWRIPKLRCTNG